MHEDCHAVYRNFAQSFKENRKPSMCGDELCFTFATSWNIPVLYVCAEIQKEVYKLHNTGSNLLDWLKARPD